MHNCTTIHLLYSYDTLLSNDLFIEYPRVNYHSKFLFHVLLFSSDCIRFLSNINEVNEMLAITVADVPCGQGNIGTRTARLIGGQNAIPHEFPWMVSISRKGGHFCGGTILNSRFVLTAAHCLCSWVNCASSVICAHVWIKQRFNK